MDYSFIGYNQISSTHLHWLIVPQNKVASTSDIITLGDILTKNINKFLNEGDTISESIGKNINKGVSDVISIVENTSSSKTIVKYINDAISIAENSVMTKGKPQLEFMNFTDSIAKTITKIVAVSDGIIAAETSGKGLVARPISDAISIIDTTSNQVYRNFVNSVIDTLNAGDSISKGIARKIVDTPGMIDNLSKGIMKMVSDGIITAEVISLNITSILLEQTRTIRPNTNINLEAEGALVNL